jgi:putative transposase
MPTFAHKIRLTPTPEQDVYFKKACGTARFTYNWALAEWRRQYQAGQKPSALGLKKQFNALKRREFPWILDVTKCAPEGAFMNLGKAFTNFFAKRAKYPRFHKRGVHDRVSFANDKVKVSGRRVQIPKLGWVKMTEALRFTGKILSVVVSRIANKWFISLIVEMSTSPYPRCENQARVGVDVGVKTLATLSTGEVFTNPKVLMRYARRLARYQRQVSRKQKGRQNREKAKLKVSRLHYKIACLRADVTHKLTTYLTRNFKLIGMETLHVAGMLKNHRLAKAVSDANVSEIHRQITYKAAFRENVVVQADRWYPSSKRCSVCGMLHTLLTLSDRVFTCPSCGAVKDRDRNAAENPQHYAVRWATPELTPEDKAALAIPCEE